MKREIHSVPAPSLMCEAFENVRPQVKHLYYVGDLKVLEKPSIAIVGTRSASQYGMASGFKIAKELSKNGWVVVSGLARGVDGAAHRGALSGGTPTVAVLAHGLDRVYPTEHRELAEQILREGGLLLSEYEEGVPPEKYHFPLRNRIIAAVSQSVVVIEAKERSGSLITAQFSLDLGKDVYVVPGKYGDPGYQGSHALIQEGAQLLREVSDISGTRQECQSSSNPLKKVFLEGNGTATLEDLFVKTRFSLADLHAKVDALLQSGDVIEVFPQQYSWITA